MLATWCEESTLCKRPWCWERLRARGEGGNKGWDGRMAPLTQWTWVWANSTIMKEREAWFAAVHEVSQSQTWLSNWTSAWIISEKIKILKVREEESEVGAILHFPLVCCLFWLACPCMNAFLPPPPWNLNKWMNKTHWEALYAKHHPRHLGDKAWSYFMYFPSQGSVGPMFLSLLWASIYIPILLKTRPPHTTQCFSSTHSQEGGENGARTFLAVSERSKCFSSSLTPMARVKWVRKWLWWCLKPLCSLCG